MINYKCIISYLGYKFSGYAKQLNVITVQEEIEKELSLIFNYPISIISSGRTDKYVHAINQVIHFLAPIEIDTEKLKNALNKKLLSSNILFNEITIVDNHFHARYQAKNKTYLYIINTGKINLFENDLVFQYCKPISIKKLKKISKIFLGTNNFLSFSTSELKDTIRALYFIKIKRRKNKVFIYINGNGFLRNMVRMIIGQFLLFNEDKISIDDVKVLFNNPKKGSSIYKVPGCGLYLYKVNY